MAETPNGFYLKELVVGGFVSVLAFPVKMTNSPMENLTDYWNEILEAYVCPRPKCGGRNSLVLQGLEYILRVHL